MDCHTHLPVYGMVLAHKTTGTMTVHSKVHTFLIGFSNQSHHQHCPVALLLYPHVDLAHKALRTKAVHLFIVTLGIKTYCYCTHLPNRFLQSVHQLLPLCSCHVVILTVGISIMQLVNIAILPDLQFSLFIIHGVFPVHLNATGSLLWSTGQPARMKVASLRLCFDTRNCSLLIINNQQ